eukprot:scaffold2366_cov115-Cylindrotheca_fusiformis.AAC.16
MASNGYKLLLPLCLNYFAVGMEYPYATADTSAYQMQTESLLWTTTNKSSRVRKPRASLLLYEDEEEAVDAWMKKELDTTDLESSTVPISPLQSPPMNRLGLHLEQQEWTTTDDNNDRHQSQRNLDKSLLKKTGTTIAGCCVGKHVILAADTRATAETMVADKMCQKLHPLAQNAWCAGAGTSADLDHLTKECMYSMSLDSLLEQSIGNGERGRQNNMNNNLEVYEDDLAFLGIVSIHQLCRFFQDSLFRASGELGANLILGGVYQEKAYLRAIHPHGSMDIDLPFAALGSGGLAAMGVLENGYADVSTVEDGIALCQRAIVSGIKNDLGSGSQVDVCVIYPDGTSKLQRCAVPEEILEDEFGNSTAIANKKIQEEEEDQKVSVGVNGFGNLPFAIESTRTRLVSLAESQEERLQKWNSLLGLTKEEESKEK